MILRIKNKLINAMDRMLEDTLLQGGVPDSFVLSELEASTFLAELNRFNSTTDLKDVIRLFQKDKSKPDIRLRIWNPVPLTKTEIQVLVQDWIDKAYRIQYKGINIVVATKK